jgi:hypothetical protein
LAGIFAKRHVAAGIADGFQLCGAKFAFVEEREFIGREAGERTAGAGRAAAHTRVFLRKAKDGERKRD